MHSLLWLSAFSEGQQLPSARAEVHQYLRTAALDKDSRLKILQGVDELHWAVMTRGEVPEITGREVCSTSPFRPASIVLTIALTGKRRASRYGACVWTVRWRGTGRIGARDGLDTGTAILLSQIILRQTCQF